MASDPQYKHSELTESIIGVFYDVYNELGFGFLESVYRKALKLSLEEKGLTVEAELLSLFSFTARMLRIFAPIWS